MWMSASAGSVDIQAFTAAWPYGGSHLLPTRTELPACIFFFRFSLRDKQTARDLLTWKERINHEINKQATLQKYGLGGNMQRQRRACEQIDVSTLYPENERGESQPSDRRGLRKDARN